jgi:hypothetical protein
LLFNNSLYNENTFLLCSLKDNDDTIPNAQRFGFFSSRLWQDYEINLRNEIKVFGAIPGYLLWYQQIGDDFPVRVAEYNANLGICTVINQDLRSDELSPLQNDLILKEIVNGKWDDFFRRFARQARDQNSKIYYRFGYEMNGDWFPWGKKSKLFVTAWKHVWKIFNKEKADNILWVFSPSVIYGQLSFEKDVLPYYPGDEFVDIVALDGYNFGDYHDDFHQWESFYKVFERSIQGLMSFGKPMWIAEIGCPSDPRRTQWLQDFLEFFDSNRCFDVFFWFNENKKNEPNFRIDADAESQQIFRRWAQGIHNSENSFDDLARSDHNSIR